MILAACKPQAEVIPATAEPTVEITLEPTPTMVPMAALVNGEGITLVDFQAELSRYQNSPTTGQAAAEKPAEEIVLDSMIENLLFKQGAVENGYQSTPEEIQQKVDQLITRVGGNAAFDSWMQQNGYDLDSLKSALADSIAAAWMRDKIISEVPSTAEQVHVLQVLVFDEAEAQGILQQVRTGVDFATLAEQYDPITGGDLGWFPRGYLLQPDVETAAFDLQPGGVSDVIATSSGYHIIQVVEREEQHTLSPDAYAVLQQKALQDWIASKKQASQIETFIQ